MTGSCEVLTFDGRAIRTLWDEQGDRRLFSAVDAIAALGLSASPNRYWSDAKRAWRRKADQADGDILDAIASVPLPDAGGATRTSDVLDAAGLQKVLARLRSPRSADLAAWLMPASAKDAGTLAREGSAREALPVLPLTGTPFALGHAAEAAEALADPDLRAIAYAELHFYRGEAQACVEAAKPYLESDGPSLRLSACMLTAYASLTLGDVDAAKAALSEITGRLEALRSSVATQERHAPTQLEACCVLSAYVGTVLLHLPSDDLPPLDQMAPALPAGLRVLAAYVTAHAAYLAGDYERGLGLAQGTLLASGEVYPIPLVYLRCVMAMCQISLRREREAEESLLAAWGLARADGLVEAFVEHHGPLRGLVEHCIRHDDPESYDAICDKVVAFSRGWMRVHNAKTHETVTDRLTPMEFSVAMLACRRWTNRQIASYLGLSPNTVKHYLSAILATLGVSRREDLRPFVLR
ncbi:MAG: LuxR C-terminal-related transcriptional regulator [Atopobiaceae bacterium]|jgi:DNA-binding CsgD family transcriptional regulator|nr:LuxR C-terminal-related transcriptional regulator [Atopobiaceae bacterium]